MRGNRGKNTTPELTLRRALRKRGYGGYRLHWKKAPGHPDICYPGRKIAIFVNGCFWHRCPKCDLPMPVNNLEYWSEKFKRNRERDMEKNDALIQEGWTVITVWECEIKEDIEKVVNDILHLF